jgi:ADP-ribose pyrophosphatase YjhB (NUDIX family)
MSEYVKILIKDRNKILQHHYLNNKNWGLPGGRIENQETPVNAAARELLERTGFKINPLDLTFKRNFLDEKGLKFHLFVGSISNIEKNKQASNRNQMDFAAPIR